MIVQWQYDEQYHLVFKVYDNEGCQLFLDEYGLFEQEEDFYIYV